MANETAAVVTESAPAEVTQTKLEGMTTEARDNWRLKGTPFPAEKKAPAATATTEEVETAEGTTEEDGETEATSEPATKPAQAKKPLTPAEKRIKELLADRHRSREENAELKRRLDNLEKRTSQEPRPAPEKKDAAVPAKKELRAEPQLDDKDSKGKDKYEDYNAFIKDLRAWDQERFNVMLAEEREKTLKEVDSRQEKRTKEQEAARTNQVIQKEWSGRVGKAREKYADFDAVALDTTLPVNEGSVADSFVLESKFGTDVLYYLGKHKDELLKINTLNPIAQARALLEIEQKFSKPSKKEKAEQQESLEEEFDEELESEEEELEEEEEEPAKKVTQAPAPVRALGGRGSRPSDEAKAAGARGDVGEYIRIQNAKEIAAKRRA